MMNAENMGEKWVAGWNSKDSVAFSMLYSPHGKYIDPSFGIVQRGREAISSHHEKWWNAIPDSRMIAERIYVTDGAVIVQVIGEGTFSGADLAGGKMKATSLPFRGRTCAVLELDDDGKIACCTEYYDRAIIPGGAKPPFDHLA
jgi:ketosteroid isomerase-like protein